MQQLEGWEETDPRAVVTIIPEFTELVTKMQSWTAYAAV